MVATVEKMTRTEKVIVAVALAVGIAGTAWPAVAVIAGILQWPVAVATQWAFIAFVFLCREPVTRIGRRYLAGSRS